MWRKEKRVETKRTEPAVQWGALSALVFVFSLWAILASPKSAQAVPLVEKTDHYVVLDGSFKSFFYALHMPFHPDTLLGFMGMNKNRSAIAIGDVRLKLEGSHKSRWKWQFHLHTQGMVSSFPNAMEAMGTAGSARPPRSLPLQTFRPDDPTFYLYHEVDRLNVRARFGPVDLILGRQPISFGVGFVWQPADLVGTFSPLAVDREYKPGVDALRVNWAVGAFSELALVVAAGGPACRQRTLPSGESCHDYESQFSLDHSVALTRFRTTVGKWDLGALAGWVRGDVVGGLFATGTVKRFRLRSEAVITWDVEKDPTYAGEESPNDEDELFVRAVLGADYRFDTKKPLSVLLELYYNGFGTRKPEEYMQKMREPRLAEFGEVLNVGILYAAAGVNWEPHHRVPLSLTVMGNLTDPSMHVSANITYKLGDNSVLDAGAFIPIGRAPKINALGFPELSSEFGLYPHLYYVAWKMYF